MSDNEVQHGIDIQRALLERLAEFAYADRDRAERISREMAVVASKGRTFSEHTVPLFLGMSRDNPVAVAQLALAMKAELEELTDALLELRQELPDWVEFFCKMAKE